MAQIHASRDEMQLLVRTPGWKAFMVRCFDEFSALDLEILASKETRDGAAEAKKRLKRLMEEAYTAAGVSKTDNPFAEMDKTWLRERLNLPLKAPEAQKTAENDPNSAENQLFVPPTRRSGAV